ncbi:DUF6455 family protein [Tabrizicola sp.]|mgnify:CR=1 FL=1|uniref:DUF6455 family protein n=1 Tax=Tabrizicola sp. TaxID=2005166 RepID=UPI001A519E70|nr:DUF6455 family protein [Tabrizicola sp.]MBL9072122.1 DUF1127 domain-containing protein [Tabrizicola sp.]
MFHRIRNLIDRLHAVQEVNALSDQELDDIGMSREQVIGFLNMPRDISERVTAMGRIFGISELELKRDHLQWIDLLTVCGHCADRGACARVLAKGDAARPSEAHFCGNRASFSTLAAQGH